MNCYQYAMLRMLQVDDCCAKSWAGPNRFSVGTQRMHVHYFAKGLQMKAAHKRLAFVLSKESAMDRW